MRSFNGVSLSPGQNVGFYFDSDEDHRAILRDFVLEGLFRDEKILYLTARRTPEQMRAVFADIYAAQQTWLGPEQVCLVPAISPPLPASYPLVENFSQFVREQSDLARKQGFSGLRITSERLLSVEFIHQSHERIAYKNQIQAVLRELGATMLCQYDLRLFDNSALMDLLTTHQKIIYRRQIHTNFYFVPFVFEEDGRSEITLRTCLRNLNDRSKAERDIQLRIHQQSLIAELGRDALAGISLDALMDKVVKSVGHALGCDFSRVLELVPEGRVMTTRASSGWSAQALQEPPPTCNPRSLEGFALLEVKHPVVLSASAQTQPLCICTPLPDLHVLSGACVAIPGPSRPFGVLGVYSAGHKSFVREDLLFLQSAANILAVAIERQRADREIQKLAYYDSLTGLPNRALLYDRLERALSHARRTFQEVGILFLDLDRFKSINDTLGHASGDDLLKIIAERLIGCVRHCDTVARLGGDEFVVVLTDIDREDGVAGVAQKILYELTRPVLLGTSEVTTTTSIGIAVFPEDGEDVGALLRHADIALYQAKDRGKNIYQFFSPEMNARVQERVQVEINLRKALERREFFLLYQPQLDLHSGRMVGVEALLRWNHPELGVITPERFIGVAEETGLILNIGQWVLAQACDQLSQWRKQSFAGLRLAVNISPRQFNHPCFIDMLDEVLENSGIEPSCLELELTESTIMENADVTLMTLTDIKVRGISLAIDDFGTGYSSLSYLKHFPFDRLKIAQSFVRDLTSDQDNFAIVNAVIAVAHSLNIKVIAEGVETLQQLQFLRARQCDEMQGFYFGHPMTAEKLSELLRAGFALKDVCRLESCALHHALPLS